MSDDIVERLRAVDGYVWKDIYGLAADEVKRLRAENERLRAKRDALADVAVWLTGCGDLSDVPGWPAMRDKMTAALFDPAGGGTAMSDEPRERCSHQDSKGKRRVKSECGYCQRDAEIVRLRAELERTRQAWVNGDDPMCEDVCVVACKGPCGVQP